MHQVELWSRSNPRIVDYCAYNIQIPFSLLSNIIQTFLLCLFVVLTFSVMYMLVGLKQRVTFTSQYNICSLICICGTSKMLIIFVFVTLLCMNISVRNHVYRIVEDLYSLQIFTLTVLGNRDPLGTERVSEWRGSIDNFNWGLFSRWLLWIHGFHLM